LRSFSFLRLLRLVKATILTAILLQKGCPIPVFSAYTRTGMGLYGWEPPMACAGMMGESFALFVFRMEGYCLLYIISYKVIRVKCMLIALMKFFR
jgi:hypothetical protein